MGSAKTSCGLWGEGWELGSRRPGLWGEALPILGWRETPPATLARAGKGNTPSDPGRGAPLPWTGRSLKLGSQPPLPGGGLRVRSPLPRGLTHTRGKPRRVSHGVEKGEQGRLRPRDPRTGLSHARSSLADPHPLPPRDREREAHCRWTTELKEERSGAGGGEGSTRQAAREAPVPMVTGGLSAPRGGVPLSAGTAPARRGSPRALR